MKRDFLALLYVVSVATASAHDGTVTISGTIQDNTCEIASTSQNQTITMGNVALTSFHSVGDKTPTVPLKIELKNCGPAASGAKVTFSGAADKINDQFFAVQEESDAAKGVALALYDSNEKAIAPGKASDIFPLTAGELSASLNFHARYISVIDDPVAGKANVIVTYTINYL